jgi:crossover junction endodeoxyribonuclease RusA
MITLELPWPDKALSPNARPHWARLAAARRYAHTEGLVATKQALAGRAYTPPDSGPITVALTFCPKVARVRDRDNFQAACKAYLDGIAQALGVNDSRFYVVSDWGEKRRGGAVVVTIGKGE